MYAQNTLFCVFIHESDLFGTSIAILSSVLEFLNSIFS